MPMYSLAGLYSCIRSEMSGEGSAIDVIGLKFGTDKLYSLALQDRLAERSKLGLRLRFLYNA